MELLENIAILKCLVFGVLFILMTIILTLTKLIFNTYLLGFIIYFACGYYILRYVGRFAMYPGSNAFITGDL